MLTHPPADIVDQHPAPAPRHGTTWHTHIDAFLDELNRRDRERQNALDALTRFTRNHPHLEHDTDLTAAQLALLR